MTHLMQCSAALKDVNRKNDSTR